MLFSEHLFNKAPVFLNHNGKCNYHLLWHHITASFSQGKGKVKVTLEQATKAQRGSRDKPLLFS